MIGLLTIFLVISGCLCMHFYYESHTIATVVIDAGHGGYDPGSVGADGTMEKDVTLKLAKQVGKTLHRMDRRIKVVYVRDDDVVDWADNETDDLIGRVIFANEQKADYYLSIHLDASENLEARGYSFYIRSDDDISRAIAYQIEENLNQIHWSQSRGINQTDQEPLYVVNNLQVPSMLMEVGFITNSEECRNIQRNTRMLAKQIAAAYYDIIIKQTETE